MAENDKYPLTTDALQMWINKSIRKMQQNLDSDRSNNSGALRQSLGQNFNDSVDEKGGIITGLIDAKDYWAFVDEGVQGVGGRSDIVPFKKGVPNTMANQNATSQFKYKTKKPPLKEILRWVKTKLPAKGNDLFSALNIREGIFRKGMRATNFASDVLTEQAINELNDEIADTLEQDIANQFEE